MNLWLHLQLSLYLIIFCNSSSFRSLWTLSCIFQLPCSFTLQSRWHTDKLFFQKVTFEHVDRLFLWLPTHQKVNWQIVIFKKNLVNSLWLSFKGEWALWYWLEFTYFFFHYISSKVKFLFFFHKPFSKLLYTVWLKLSNHVHSNQRS